MKPGKAIDLISREKNAGFTLMEILLAILAFAVLMAALQTVFFSALRSRRESQERIADLQRRSQVRGVLERDLRNALFQTNGLATYFLLRSDTEGAGRADQLEFFTTTGVISDANPAGEIQRVVYATAPADQFSTNQEGRILYRAIYRKLLSEVEESPSTTILLRDVASFEVACFDGSEWIESWDSTLLDGAHPTAVRVVVRPVEVPERDWKPTTIEVLTPWTIQPLAAAETSSGGGQTGGSPNGGGSEGTSPGGSGGAGGPPAQGAGGGARP